MPRQAMTQTELNDLMTLATVCNANQLFWAPDPFVSNMPMVPDRFFNSVMIGISADPNVIQCALVLYERATNALRTRAKNDSTRQNLAWGFVFHRLFTVCVQLACKWLNDVTYTNLSFAEVLGVDIVVYNRMEVFVFQTLLGGLLATNMKDIQVNEDMYEAKARIIRDANAKKQSRRQATPPFKVHLTVQINTMCHSSTDANHNAPLPVRNIACD